MTEIANDFDVAKAIFEQLKDIKGDRQERILRWVGESLGIDVNLTGRHAAPRSEPNIGVQADLAPLAGKAQATPNIKTFVANKNPKSDVKFAAVVAYYYRFEAPENQRKESITKKLIEEATRLTGRKRLSNPLGTLNNARTLGYLDSAGRGAYKINTVGENLVAMILPSKEGDSPRVVLTRRKSRKRAFAKTDDRRVSHEKPAGSSRRSPRSGR